MSYSEIKTPRVTFRLLHRGEGRESFARDWPATADAILIELVQRPPIAKVDDRIEAYIAELENNPNLHLLAERAKKDRSLVCFGDLDESPGLSSLRDFDLMTMEFLMGLLAVGGGIGLLFKKLSVGEKLGKSLMLRSLSLLAIGSWLLTSLVETLGIFLVRTAGDTAKKGLLRAVREAIAQASNLHPEKTVVFLRNLVLAEKAWEVADLELKNHHEPVVVLDFHFGHAGILKMLRWSPEKRRKLLRLYCPLIKNILKDPIHFDYLARLIIVAWDGRHWEVRRNYLVDSLEALSGKPVVKSR